MNFLYPVWFVALVIVVVIWAAVTWAAMTVCRWFQSLVAERVTLIVATCILSWFLIYAWQHQF